MTDAASRSRREAVWIVLIWASFAAWVLGYAALFAYPADPTKMGLTLGLPTWVVYGVVLPWLAATALTIVFSLVVMEDDDPISYE